MMDQESGLLPETALSNSERLLQHLPADSLAARLVQAHRASPDPIDRLKKTLAERLDQVRQDLGGP